MKIRSLTLAALVLAAFTSLQGQTIVQRTDSLYAARFEPAKGLILEFRKDKYFQLDPLTGRQQAFAVPGIGEMTLTHNPFLVGNTLYLVKSSSGPVYKVSGSSMTRIDRSIDHNVMQGAVTFLHRDTIFRFGGRDKWHALANLLYFDRFTHEWEVFRPLHSTEFPTGMWDNIAHAQGDSVFIFGGYRIKTNDPLMKEPNQDVWLCDLRRKTWTNLGPAHPLIASAGKLENMQQFSNGRHELIMFTPTEKLIRMDFSKNSLSVIPFPDQRVHPIHRRYNCFLMGGKFHFFSSFDHFEKIQTDYTAQDFLLQSIPATTILSTSSTAEKIYLPSEENLLLPLIALAATVVSGLAFVRFRKKKKVAAELDSTGILLGGQHFPLEEVQLLLLRQLIKKPEGLVSNDLIEILERSGNETPPNLRNKVNLVSRLNLELRGIFRIEDDLIKETRSGEDKRIKQYTLRHGFFR